MEHSKKILVIGGGGYVGSCLVPALLNAGHQVRVLDLFIYGKNALPDIKEERLELIQGDMRNLDVLKKSLLGQEVVFHLACISNDPSFELDPELGKSINYDCFEPLLKLSIDAGVKKFIYASSSSVYGVKKEERVTEELSLEPLTDYSKYKALSEDVLLKYTSKDFVTCMLRPATICGCSPRQRLDLTVNLLTNLAFHKGEITVFGGDQERPNLHMEDMVRAYLHILEQPSELINGQCFNVGFENYTVKEIAKTVQSLIGQRVTLRTTSSDDKRSYRVDSQKIQSQLGFVPQADIKKAISQLQNLFASNALIDPLNNKLYHNVKMMKEYGFE